jgi:hypothetical protein
LEYWRAQVRPAECDGLLKQLAKTTKAARDSAKSFVRVWGDHMDESLTFTRDGDDDEFCYWLMDFVRDDVGEDKDIAALLEAATGNKVDLTAIDYEDRFDEHAKDIIPRSSSNHRAIGSSSLVRYAIHNGHELADFPIDRKLSL